MAEESREYLTDKAENTDMDDTDLVMVGNKGTGVLRKITWSNVLNNIKSKFVNWLFSDLTTTDQTIPGAINELNSALENLTQSNAGAHNCVVRGKFLGTSVTSAQWAAIKAGTFDDMYLKDYWTLNGYDFLIGDFDYCINSGNTRCTDHHIAIIPRGCLYIGSMNDSNTTEGAYVGSQMYQTGLDEALSIIQSAFGADHILQHAVYFQNATTDGRPSGGAWSMEYLETPDEQMIYGMPIRQQMSSGGTGYTTTTINIRQLALMQHDHESQLAMGTGAGSNLTTRYAYWLRNVYSASGFCIVNYNGYAYSNSASADNGVRPVFLIY